MNYTILSHPHSGVKLLRTLIKKNFDEDMNPDKQHIMADQHKYKVHRPILLVRDGRDVMASMYFGEQQRSGKFKSFTEFLTTPWRPDSVNPVDYWVNYYEGWIERGVQIVLKFEDMVADQHWLLDCLRWYFAKKPVHGPVKRLVGVPTTVNGYDPGGSNWEKCFGEEDLKFFEQRANYLMRWFEYV